MGRSVWNPPHTPALAGCSRAYETQCTRLEHEGSIIIARDRGPHRPRPFRRPLSFNGCRPRAWSEKTGKKTFKNSTTPRAVCPFSQTGFLRLCSLDVVICMFFEDFGYGKTSKSRRIASTNGRSLSILPPSVLAIRGDLLVFRIQNLQKTRKSLRKASRDGEHLFG